VHPAQVAHSFVRLLLHNRNLLSHLRLFDEGEKERISFTMERREQKQFRKTDEKSSGRTSSL
jgi:hypothetical protein